MPTIDKSVMIPQYTEVEVSIETEEFLDDMETSDILDYLIRDIGLKDTFRRMQSEHDFTQGDIEEAYGERFGGDITASAIVEARDDGKISQETLIDMVDDETIIDYYHTKIKSHAVLNQLEVLKYIRIASPANKLEMLKHLLGDNNEA